MNIKEAKAEICRTVKAYTAKTEAGLYRIPQVRRRPILLMGAPGIGKSAIVQEFADSLGLECVSLLGSQLAPEDIIRVPQIKDGFSQFCPPRTIARSEPYVLFLDGLNACTSEVQKAFYPVAEKLYKNANPEGGCDPNCGGCNDDGVVDADYQTVD